MRRRTTQLLRLPSATYRLQLNQSFPFEKAREIVAYLDELGISDVYTSPFFMARPGSLHGYDVTDHSQFNPEIGDEESFLDFSAELQRHHMGLVADVVPNHMCVTHPSNVWWWDVLENGPSSRFALYFDIDWHPPKEELTNKVLLPVLGDQYGRVLENQEIQAGYNRRQLHIELYGNHLPLAPNTWTMILEPALAKLRDRLHPEHEHVVEMESIVTALNHLPGDTETEEAKIRERQREKEVVSRRLSKLLDASPESRELIESTVKEINGERGNPHSFDRLERLLGSQAYRLSFWRVATDEINYRRFFDINDLAAIRPEDPEVFAAVHALIFDLVKRGHITGLRVDHPDGLFDPEKYFRFLRDGCNVQATGGNGNGSGNGASRLPYVAAEKILIKNESLRTNWPVEGTTGYDFLNLVNGLFIDRGKEKAIRLLYQRFTGWSENFLDLIGDSKRLILQVAMSSELNVLARKLDSISEQHRWSRDFTLESLRDALREVLAAFPVYRTYVRSDDQEIEKEDRRQILIAIREAKRRNPAIDGSVFDFIQSLLLLEHPDGLDPQQRAERQMFTMRFQQLTAPVMAKGVEDTAFYRYYPLASLNEVGGSLDRFGLSATSFHRGNGIRQQFWPHSMNATSTHDTKRSEDVRARINVLSEIPRDWYLAIRRWSKANQRSKTSVDGVAAPDANEEYLLYQSLIGTWPLEEMNGEQHARYVKRIKAYMLKALHEAKIHSSWTNPHGEYDQAVEGFVERVLELSSENGFLEDFRQFQAPIARAGMWNSLSQLLLKITAPGVPDFYQGSELWNFHLVDPDNRQPVDFERRKQLAERLRREEAYNPATTLCRLAMNPFDGGIKLYLTSRALQFRKLHGDLFAEGNYIPVAARGLRANHVVAFAREFGDQTAIAVAGRFFLRLHNSYGSTFGDQVWGSTTLLLPKRIKAAAFRDVFSGRTLEPEQRGDYSTLPLSQAFSYCPFALLYSGSKA